MTDNGSFEGQVVVVTGGARGIGAATCRAFTARGAHVAVVDINGDAADDLVAALGAPATAHHTDVTDEDAVASMAAEVLGAHGRVDVLVNNAGHWVRVTPFHMSTPAQWDDVVDINFRHMLLVTRAFIGSMIEQGGGVIVNVSSIEGVRAYPSDPVYAAAKAAANHFTRSLAVAYGRKGLRVVGIAPDITNTDQVVYDDDVQRDPRWSWWAPIGRFGTPEDNADVIVALASDQFRFVTGAVVNTDGGTGTAGGWFWSDQKRTFVNRPDALG
jgi:NAD(P)-dependent dehydrogenase (short-subunit alcohol dehydrogenase family)